MEVEIESQGIFEECVAAVEGADGVAIVGIFLSYFKEASVGFV